MRNAWISRYIVDHNSAPKQTHRSDLDQFIEGLSSRKIGQAERILAPNHRLTRWQKIRQRLGGPVTVYVPSSATKNPDRIERWVLQKNGKLVRYYRNSHHPYVRLKNGRVVQSGFEKIAVLTPKDLVWPSSELRSQFLTALGVAPKEWATWTPLQIARQVGRENLPVYLLDAIRFMHMKGGNMGKLRIVFQDAHERPMTDFEEMLILHSHLNNSTPAGRSRHRWERRYR